MRIEGPTPAPAPEMGKGPSATAVQATVYSVLTTLQDLQKQTVTGGLAARERLTNQ